MEKPRNNPYRDMTDDELARKRDGLLEAYVTRLEYFESLPEWQTTENYRAIFDDLPAWGMTRMEFDEWTEALRVHFVAAADLANVARERHRRLSEAARRRVSACQTWEQARAVCDGYKPPEPAGELCRRDGETVLDLVLRVEEWHDAIAELNGALAAECESLDRWMAERSAAVLANWRAARGGTRR